MASPSNNTSIFRAKSNTLIDFRLRSKSPMETLGKRFFLSGGIDRYQNAERLVGHSRTMVTCSISWRNEEVEVK